MKRAWLGIATAALAGLLSLEGANAQSNDKEKELYEAAKAEGPVTWYNAHYSLETGEKLAAAFAKKYPGLTANAVRASGQVLYQRIQQELGAGVNQADVFSASDVSHLVDFKTQGIIAEYTPANFDTIIPDYQIKEGEGFFTYTAFSLFVYVYNNSKVAEADAPKSWKDLLDPKWKGQVTIVHPGFSGIAGPWVVSMQKLYGDQFLEDLAKNDPHVVRSLFDPVKVVTAGERLVGLSNTNAPLAQIAQGNPLTIVYPEDGAMAIKLPSAVMAKSQNPNGARLFLDFLLSKEANEVFVADYWLPTQASVSPAPGSKGFNEVKLLDPTIKEISEGVAPAIETFRTVFGI